MKLASEKVAFQGLPSTLCKGCGHNSITSYLIEACKSISVNPSSRADADGYALRSQKSWAAADAAGAFKAEIVSIQVKGKTTEVELCEVLWRQGADTTALVSNRSTAKRAGQLGS